MAGSITMAVAGLQPRSAVTRAISRGSAQRLAENDRNKKTAPEGGFD